MGDKPRRKFYILDFDGTITKSDTTGAVFKAALSVQNERGNDLTTAWKAIIAAYAHGYQAHAEAYRPSKGERDTAEAEIEFYRSLRAVEEKSFERVSKSGIFAGISEERWEELGRQAVCNGDVTLREGFDLFLRNLKDTRARWAVVSVNFSNAFIRGVLSCVVGPEAREILVLSNQPNRDGVLKGPAINEGTFGEVLATSDAKLASVKALITSWDIKVQDNILYLGDSGTDIECLMWSGATGIILSEDRKSDLIVTICRIGIEVSHMGDYREEAPRSLYWASNFLDIVQSRLMKY